MCKKNCRYNTIRSRIVLITHCVLFCILYVSQISYKRQIVLIRILFHILRGINSSFWQQCSWTHSLTPIMFTEYAVCNEWFRYIHSFTQSHTNKKQSRGHVTGCVRNGLSKLENSIIDPSPLKQNHTIPPSHESSV